MSETIHTQLPYSAALEALVTLPQEVTGDSSISRKMLEKCANELFRLIRKAFLIKSAGGTDDAGDRWALLSIKTVEARARARGARITKRSIKKRKSRFDKRYNTDNPNRRRIKSAINNNQSTHDKYARIDTAILLNTKKLLESLSPNSSSPDQILILSNGQFIIGTKRTGAAAHHKGVPGRLPQRRLWPEVSSWPNEWWDKITRHIKDGTIESVKELIKGAM